MAGKDQATDPAAQQGTARAVPLAGVINIAKATFISMRPLQWTKGLLVFVPLAFSVGERWELDEPELFGELFLRAVGGAIIFCALSGAVYIINDIFDREGDRAHPRKRTRPIASGELSLPAAHAIAVLLLAASLAGSFVMDVGFGLVSIGFLAINLGYSTFIKRIIILDVMAVGSGYLLRVVAGALVIDVDISPWLYVTIGLGALFIALGKRYSELSSAGSNASTQRAVLEQYTPAFLNQLITLASTGTLVAYSLYTFSASNVPENHSTMLTIPFVIFGLSRYLYLVNHTNEAESPELIIIRDKPLVIGILLWAATAITIMALNR